ncbi:apolipoprotein N-acyltransferase [Brumimicrobium salinarum]|uniref:Apolipoprotein N-acyltransferase n=1 Tax=Brumimicrobium salinarum TaxID=2058658 RepID=A0A2I0R1V7_9FLAO|nr:apolipoprotein N-acyltransferase [Brumimicrobium salinarum]PKR80564.1 apolipoprotein N-acyltransferase [Brumimicrobium salinarum]
MKLTRLQRYLLSILSGILMVVSFPHTGSIFPLVFIAWVPLLLVEHNIYREKYKSGKVLLHAYITFFIYNLGTTYWIYYSIGGEAGAILAYFLNGFLMALVFMLFHWTKKYVGQKEGYIGLLFFWIGFEYLHFHWELSWPWINIGNTFATVPEIVQWYSYTGILGGALWILLINMLVFKISSNLIFKKESFKIQTPLIYLSIFLLIIPALLSYWSYASYQEKENPIEVVVTQPNVDPYNEKFSTDVKTQLDKFVLDAEALITPKTSVVLAPETAISQPFNEDQYQTSAAFNYLQERVNNWGGTSLFTGASTYKTFDKKVSAAAKPIAGSDMFYESYNTSALISKIKPPSFVHKSELVLGVEKIPFSEWFPFLEELSVQNGGTSGTLGVEEEPRVLNSHGFTFAPIICYESIYGGMIAEQCRKGAEVIFVITNDGWWGNSAGHKQHASIARLRAVETGRYVVRSANTGTSCVINQRGDVLKATDYWVRDAFKSVVHLNNRPTFYITYGDVIGRSFSFVFFLLIILTIVKYLKTFGTSV